MIDDLMTLFDKAAGAHVNIAFRHLAETDTAVAGCIQREQTLRADFRAAVEQELAEADGRGFTRGANAARAAAQPQPEARVYPLPDDLYPGSKDWMASDYAGRVEWLHGMYESARREADMWCERAQPETQPEAQAMPRWWTCATHGDAMPQNAWGCPECVREQREQIKLHDAQMMRAIAALNEARAQRDALRDHPEKQPELVQPEVQDEYPSVKQKRLLGEARAVLAAKGTK